MMSLLVAEVVLNLMGTLVEFTLTGVSSCRLKLIGEGGRISNIHTPADVGFPELPLLEPDPDPTFIIDRYLIIKGIVSRV